VTKVTGVVIVKNRATALMGYPVMRRPGTATANQAGEDSTVIKVNIVS